MEGMGIGQCTLLDGTLRPKEKLQPLMGSFIASCEDKDKLGVSKRVEMKMSKTYSLGMFTIALEFCALGHFLLAFSYFTLV